MNKKTLIISLICFILSSSLFAAEQSTILLAKNGIQVTSHDLLLFLAQGGDKNKQIVNLKSPKNLKKIINHLYLTKILAKEALELKLDQDPTIAYQLKQARLTILKGARLQGFKPKKMPDFEDTAKLDYFANPEKYEQPDKVQVAHIMVNLVDRTEEEALNRIKEVQSKILLGEDFAILAKEYSDDRSSNDKGGILSAYAKNELLKPFADAAFLLEKKDDMSDIVKTDRGYHLIKLIKKIPAHLTPFNDVKEKLIKKLEAKYTAAKKKDYILSKKEKIKQFPIEEKNLENFVKQRLVFLEQVEE